MSLKTITHVLTENPLEALYVYLADPSVVPTQRAEAGNLVWELQETRKNRKAIADLQDGKKKASIAIADVTDKNLAAVGVQFSTAEPARKRRGRPAGSKAAKTAAPKKRGRKKKTGGRMRLNPEQKKFIADNAVKGKGQTEIQRAFAEKYGYEPSYATIHNYVMAARKKK